MNIGWQNKIQRKAANSNGIFLSAMPSCDITAHIIIRLEFVLCVVDSFSFYVVIQCVKGSDVNNAWGLGTQPTQALMPEAYMTICVEKLCLRGHTEHIYWNHLIWGKLTAAASRRQRWKRANFRTWKPLFSARVLLRITKLDATSHTGTMHSRTPFTHIHESPFCIHEQAGEAFAKTF